MFHPLASLWLKNLVTFGADKIMFLFLGLILKHSIIHSPIPTPLYLISKKFPTIPPLLHPQRLGYLSCYLFQNTTSLHTWQPVSQRALPFLSLLPSGPHVHRGNTVKHSRSDIPIMIRWAFFFFFRYILYIVPKLTPVSFLFVQTREKVENKSRREVREEGKTEFYQKSMLRR